MLSRRSSAHARLKSNYRKHLEIAIAIGIGVHLLTFALVPPPPAEPPAALEPLEKPTEILNPPPEYRILAPPAPVQRPNLDHIGQIADVAPPPFIETILNDDVAPPFAEPEWGRRGVRAGADFVAVLTEPELVHQPAPEYDDTSRELGMTGTVLVEALVGRDGRVLQVRILRADAPERLQQAALRSARDCLFRPGRQGSRPVEVLVILPYRFTLDTR